MREGVTPRGAVVLLAGGAYMVRGNYTDTLPTAAHLRELGFQTFIVDYRLRPYTQQEGALDVARAVRFIRANADAYGIEPDDIAVMATPRAAYRPGSSLCTTTRTYCPRRLTRTTSPMSWTPCRLTPRRRV